jgi:thiamine-phosphate pyrophosphorylase
MNGKLLRLIDANANRAREGLRVVEDYCRFVLDDDRLSADLKSVRHDLTGAIAPLLPSAILRRDTPGDVGTGHSTPTESARTGIADVVTAAGKRLGEALRAIEEFAKTIDPAIASKVEAVRYRFYDIEARVARTLKSTDKFGHVRLCVLITESACRGDWFTTAEAAIDGGADVLQLREKNMDGGEMLNRARRLVELCHRRGVLLIVNDRADIAEISGADGVHVGQSDLPAVEARKIVGPDKIVGVSTHEIADARRAILDGADYIGVGPVFRSPTKPRDIDPGLPYARAAAQLDIPTVAIAGITLDNVESVKASGVTAIAVTAAATGTPDVAAAARLLKERFANPARF